MPIANSDFVPDPFPGITAPDTTGLPGSQGSRTPPDDLAVTFTGPAGTRQARTGTTTHVTQPGQLDEGFSGLGADFTATSGAGLGRAGHFPRRDFQQPDGRGTVAGGA